MNSKAGGDGGSATKTEDGLDLSSALVDPWCPEHLGGHGEVLDEAVLALREELNERSRWALREQVREDPYAGTKTWVRFVSPPEEPARHAPHYGFWCFAGRASDHTAEIRRVLGDRVGSAVHRFPARLSVDGRVFLAEDRACPSDAATVMIFDAVCRWGNWHDTALLTVTETEADGGGSAWMVGDLEPVDLDFSWLDGVLAPGPWRHRRRRRPPARVR